jgi:spore coat polysaccharide biosynthesis predicted glycosyltransferase SpsG
MELNSVLFIPVSSTSGSGEYERSIIIAKTILQQWPNTSIHFVLNENARYIDKCPFKVHLCQDSPTKETSRVNSVIKSLEPDLVVFDASGRAKQFKQAKKVGAKVAFLSQRDKKRRRGLKFNRLFNIDLHWVVQPDFSIKPLSFLQRFKIKILKKTSPKNIGPVFLPPSPQNEKYILKKLNLVNEIFYVFSSGSGSTFVGNELAADIYYQAACEFYNKTKIKCVVVFGSSYPKPIDDMCEGVICLESIENEYFISLINSAHGCVVAAGDTLLQCIALKKPCVATALSKDQKGRLKYCVSKNLALAANPTSGNICQQATLLSDTHGQERLNILGKMEIEPKQDALKIIISDLNKIIFKLET